MPDLRAWILEFSFQLSHAGVVRPLTVLIDGKLSIYYPFMEKDIQAVSSPHETL